MKYSRKIHGNMFTISRECVTLSQQGLITHMDCGGVFSLRYQDDSISMYTVIVHAFRALYQWQETACHASSFSVRWYQTQRPGSRGPEAALSKGLHQFCRPSIYLYRSPLLCTGYTHTFPQNTLIQVIPYTYRYITL